VSVIPQSSGPGASFDFCLAAKVGRSVATCLRLDFSASQPPLEDSTRAMMQPHLAALACLALLLHSGVALPLKDVIRLRCSLDPTAETYFELQGTVLSNVPGEQQQLLFNTLGMNVARCFRQPDGSYMLTSREVLLYLDSVNSTKVLKVWCFLHRRVVPA
jgi:hypothetical protein